MKDMRFFLSSCEMPECILRKVWLLGSPLRFGRANREEAIEKNMYKYYVDRKVLAVDYNKAKSSATN